MCVWLCVFLLLTLATYILPWFSDRIPQFHARRLHVVAHSVLASKGFYCAQFEFMAAFVQLLE